MQSYSSRDVAEILGVSPAAVRAQARAGFLSPGRGPGKRYRFSFQDLILLRTAKALADARVSQRRIRRSLRRLIQQLPRGRSLSEVRIAADGNRVLVRDGRTSWNPESGQFVLDFAVSDLASKVAPFARRNAEAARQVEHTYSAAEWYQLGYELEAVDPREARDAYRRALERDPRHAAAHVNLGRLLHQSGATPAAIEHYAAALDLDPLNPTALFDLGTALEDLGRRKDAIAAYQRVVEIDPGFADAHYNLSRLYEKAGNKQTALQHLVIYKRLMEQRDRR